MDKKHLLVVDIGQRILSVVEYTLEATRRRIVAVGNNRETLKEVLAAQNKNTPVDLLMIDIQMSDLTSMELIDELVQLGIGIPRLIIRENGCKKLVIESTHNGSKECRSNPHDDEELMKQVAMLIE